MTLTAEQQAALDELFAHRKNGKAAPEPAPAPKPGPSPLETVQQWLGISGGDVQGMIATLVTHADGLEAQLRTWAEERPMDTAVGFLAAASIAFYQAEREENRKIRTLVDAFYYITTCASVGYADIFAVTQTGRMIASLVMTAGPALTNRLLDRPVAAKS
jgi:hypothetical protein